MMKPMHATVAVLTALAVWNNVLALLPILIFYLICQKQIIGGVASEAVE